MSDQDRRCCTCSAVNRYCDGCVCAASRIPCRNCRPGVNCRNRGSQEDREGEEREVRDNEEQVQQSAGVGQDNRYWQGKPLEDVKAVTDTIYEKIVAFSPNNIFEIPRGNATKRLIKEMTFLISEYTRETHLSTHALKTLAILPHLICQRTHEKSRTAEDRKAMERRLDLWEKGEIQKLMREAETLQKRVKKNLGKKKQEDRSKKFASLMRQGKVAKAGRELTSEATVGTLPLNKETIL